MAEFRSILDQRLDEMRRRLRELTTQCEELAECLPLEGQCGVFFNEGQYRLMERVAEKALWLGILMIHQKRQGHPASTASAIHLMAAIYFSRAWDWIRAMRDGSGLLAHQCESQKPHAVPGWDGLLYLEGMFSKEQLQAFRTFQGPNAYPTHVDPGIQIPTGSLGMGPGACAALAFVDQYNADHAATAVRGLQMSIIGDSEFDEGVIQESIKERASRGITGWIDLIDYNRQSLDGNLDERLVDRIAGQYDVHGIPVIVLKYGSRLQEIFRQGAAGREFRRRVDALSTEDYQALLRQPGAIVRRILTLRRPEFEAFLHEGTRGIKVFLEDGSNGDSHADACLEALFAGKSDREFKTILANLGGHDLPMLISTIEKVKQEGGCAALIAYTVKGWGIEPLLGSLSGHWRMLSHEQLGEYAAQLGTQTVQAGAEWERFPEGDPAASMLAEVAKARKHQEHALEEERRRDRDALRAALSNAEGQCLIPWELPQPDDVPLDQPISTQAYLGRLLGRLSLVEPGDAIEPLVDRIVTLAADVGFTAGLGQWINRRGVWGPPATIDVMRKYGEVPEMNVQPRATGQHVRLSNLEQFLGLLAAAFGKSHEWMGVRRLPFAFFYDVFLERFAEMFKYAAYWDSPVWFVGTIAGSSAPAESGLHHGATAGVIGRVTPNVVTWEPAFPQELNWILAEEFRRAIWDEDAGRRVRYLRTAATPMDPRLLLEHLGAQPRFQGLTPDSILEAIRPEVLAGGYRLVDRGGEQGFAPGENVINIFVTGASVVEAIKASQCARQERIYANVIVVTSPSLLIDRLDNPQIRTVVSASERHACVPVLTVTDSHPSCLGGVGRRLGRDRNQPLEVALGATTFDRSGTEKEIKAAHRIDAASIVQEARRLL